MGSNVMNFNGFSHKALAFLIDVSIYNSRSWYQEHKEDYRKYILKPLQDLVMDLSDVMQEIDPYINTTPAVGKTISRIYRDVRFSKNKSLYRSHMWITFKRGNSGWQDVPAFFFEFSPEIYLYGMGFYRVSSETMKKFRRSIDENQDGFLKTINFYSKQDDFVLQGEKYKRVFDKSKSDTINEWYQRKNLSLVCKKEIGDLFFSPELVTELSKGYQLLAPIYHYLNSLTTDIQL